MDKNYFGITDTGKQRSNNEDTFIAGRIEGTPYLLACVIDGVGGYTGGEEAAAIAKSSILRLMDKPVGDLSFLMKAAIAEANDQILAAKKLNKEHEDMACVLTMALADLDNNQFYYAHVGDTRLYLLRDNTLVKISKDQSFVGFLEDSGRLTEDQAMQHPKRNEINKALGFANSIGIQEDYVEMGHSPFLPGDLLLLCSDGLSDMVNKQGISDILLQNASLAEKGRALVNLANENGGADNITVVLVANDNEASVHEATKPIAQPSKITATGSQEPMIIPVAETGRQRDVFIRNTGLGRWKVLGLNPVFIVIGLVVMALIYIIWRQFFAGTEVQKRKIPDVPINSKNAQALKLQDKLDNLQGNILVLDDSIFTSPILITEPIRIDRDSLYLRASHHIIIKSDSGYKGQPFRIAPLNRSTLLENFTLENFEDVSSLQKKGVLLKDVQFIRTNIKIVNPKSN